MNHRNPNRRDEPEVRRRPKPVKLYQPKVFKGANSREEEDRLAEGHVQRIALDILNAFEDRNERIDTMLRFHIQQNHKILTARERHNIAKTVYNVITWKQRIDYIVSKALKQNIAELETIVRNIYRLAALNIVYMHRAVDKAGQLSDFIIPKSHGPLKEPVRKMIKYLKGAEIPMPNPAKQGLSALSIIYSHPEWIIEHWFRVYGEASARKILDFDNEDQGLTIRVNTLKSKPFDVIKHLAKDEVEAHKTRFAHNGLVIKNARDLFASPGFQDGEFEIQAESSQIFAEWADPKPEQIILDACAGGGGKTLAFAALMKNTGKIIATDINSSALEQLKKRALRAGATNIEALGDNFGDILKGRYIEKLDCVAVDAPCSGLGVLQRNPDIRWRIKPEDLPRLADEQQHILQWNSRWVKHGGQLIYATCTLNPEENEKVVEKFLETHLDFYLIKEHDERFKAFVDDRGYFNVTPHEHRLSGFFAAKMARR